MARDFTLKPTPTVRVETRYRRIITDLPVPESIPVWEKLYEHEPRAMRGQENQPDGYRHLCRLAMTHRFLGWAPGAYELGGSLAKC